MKWEFTNLINPEINNNFVSLWKEIYHLYLFLSSLFTIYLLLNEYLRKTNSFLFFLEIFIL